MGLTVNGPPVPRTGMCETVRGWAQGVWSQLRFGGLGRACSREEPGLLLLLCGPGACPMAPYGSVTEEKNEGLTISHGLIVFLKLPFLISVSGSMVSRSVLSGTI